jgi:GT2 family glycosyltransferase
LYKINFLIKNYEIIIVDNNSNDGSAEYIRENYKRAKVVENRKNLGYTGINAGLPYCSGKYILFLNNDIKIDRNCVKELLKEIKKDSKIGMTAPRLINYYNKSMKSGGTWLSRAFYNGHLGSEPKLMEIPYLGVGLIRKDLTEKFGYLFDPDYFIYAEDVDLGLRLRMIGYKVLFVPEAILYHMHAMTTKSFESGFTTYLLERNLLATFIKILSFRNIILFLPYVIFMRIIALIKDIITFKFANAFSRIKAILWVIFHFNLINKKRKILQKMRTADDDFVLKVFSEKNLFRKKVIV